MTWEIWFTWFISCGSSTPKSDFSALQKCIAGIASGQSAESSTPVFHIGHDKMPGFTMKNQGTLFRWCFDLFWGLFRHDPWTFHGGLYTTGKDDHQSIFRFRVVHCGWISMKWDGCRHRVSMNSHDLFQWSSHLQRIFPMIFPCTDDVPNDLPIYRWFFHYHRLSFADYIFLIFSRCFPIVSKIFSDDLPKKSWKL